MTEIDPDLESRPRPDKWMAWIVPGGVVVLLLLGIFALLKNYKATKGPESVVVEAGTPKIYERDEGYKPVDTPIMMARLPWVDRSARTPLPASIQLAALPTRFPVHKPRRPTGTTTQASSSEK